jgi:hypothetical protein
MCPPLPLLCVICNKPIQTDSFKYVDEDGNPVHEPCYVAKATKKKAASASYRQSAFDSFA